MTNNQLQTNTLWQPQEVEFIFQSYQIFEKKLLDVLRVIPLSKENKTAWSPELVNLFLDISSLVDSVSRNIIGGGKDRDEVAQIKNSDREIITKKVGDLGIEDFEINLFSDLKLLDSRVAVYVYPLQVITPYQNYRDATGWWSIYNSLKHSRIKNYNKANLGIVLNALAGFFLLLVRCKEEEFTKALVRIGWVKTRIVPEFVHTWRLRMDGLSWHDSELFGTPEVPGNIPEDITQINPALTSPKFRKFFGRFNP